MVGDRSRGPRRRCVARLAGAGLVLGAAIATPAQGRSPGEQQVLPAVDPWTRGEPDALAALGVLGHGPFAWADGVTTAAVDAVLGERRVLWVETRHYRLGCALAGQAVPEAQKQRKALYADLAILHQRLPRIPERPKRLEPWLWALLYAQRLEAHHEAFCKLLGIEEQVFAAGTIGEGPHLGMPDKQLVLLFQKQSDLARYADRFCGLREDATLRHYHGKSRQLLAAIAADGLEGWSCSALHAHLVYLATHNLLCAYRGYRYHLPLWLAEGLAHWMSRQIDDEIISCQILDTEAVAEERQADWPIKVRRRAQFAELCVPFETMAAWTDFAAMGYQAHSQSWSRVDFLLQRDRAAFGELIRELKSLPQPSDAAAIHGPLAAATRQQLQVRYGLDAPGFDRQWREWVLKTYPKK